MHRFFPQHSKANNKIFIKIHDAPVVNYRFLKRGPCGGSEVGPISLHLVSSNEPWRER